MTPNATNNIRAAVAAHAQQQSTPHGAHAPAHRPGDQVAHYKGATLRTAFAGTRPGGMAKAMLAKLKPRPALPGAGHDGVERTEGRESALDGESRVRRHHDDGDAGGEGASGGHREREGDERDEPSKDGDDSSRENDGGGPTALRRVRARGRDTMSPRSPARTGADRLRAEWALTAMATGGEAALRSALATRLFQAARGPGTVGWRRPWLGNVGALHAAAGDARFDTAPRGLVGVRDLLVGLSASAGGHRLLPNTMRATFFCLLPLVLLDLQRPRTPRQRQDLLVRIASLARMPPTLRTF